MVTPGRLFMVGTPIGHLGDFSFRGVEVLRKVALVAAEDTRRTKRLLTHYDVSAQLVSVHAHSKPEDIQRLLDRVAAGDDVAYVTDAGTPGVSDPGGVIAESAHRRGIPVVPIPGPGAVLAALSAAGFPADRFQFLGFLPKRGTARSALLDRIAAEQWTSVCYEAPGRTVALLRDLAARCGPERSAAVARELTKLHEEIRRGTVAELAAYYEAHSPRGEVTVVIGGRQAAGAPSAAPPASGAEAAPEPDALVAELRGSGPPGVIAKELARRLGISRQDAYRLLSR
ncbi:MAG: 16S rRNA (cytidine(1402)-2'-O)-methyltransferase [Gemmatimonadetes bacterium]|nr:16S rRNA (cytidine(1402)-2'-O)-methyltransferase [Gemmatimonadota bacterium]